MGQVNLGERLAARPAEAHVVHDADDFVRVRAGGAVVHDEPPTDGALAGPEPPRQCLADHHDARGLRTVALVEWRARRRCRARATGNSRA